jgi:4-hydroxy-2-oxoheptanedioate aldolase
MTTTTEPGGSAEARLGGWSILGSRVVVEALCRAAVDFVGIDAQHGFFAFEQAAVGIQIANLCGTRVLVRVPADQMGWIPRYLDAGADGIVLAMTGSAADAERAVQLACYQPRGSRSYGGGSRNGVGEAADQAVNPAACRPEVIAMIETPGAIAELKQIVATPGLGGAWVGPVDLGLGLDRPYPLPPDDPVWRKAVAQVVSACKDVGIRPGMFAVGGEDAREWLATGFKDVVVSSDIALLRRALSEHLARSRTPVSQVDPLASREVTDPYAGR